MVRDGRDVSLSLEKQGWIRPFKWHRGQGLEVAALYWDWIVRQGRAGGLGLGEDYLELQYEELMQDPRQSLLRLSDFVGQELDFDQIQGAGISSVQRPNTSFPPNCTTENSMRWLAGSIVYRKTNGKFSARWWETF